MQLSEDEVFEKCAKHSGHCNRITLLPHGYDFTCASCGYTVIERKHELSKSSRKKNFINRLKYAEYKIFCICIDVYKKYEGNNFDKKFEVLFTL